MEKKRNDNEEMEIDLLELLMVMKKHLAAILLAGIVGLVIMFAYTSFLVTPLYSASSMMYVMPDNSNSMNSYTLNDMQVGQQLTSDYSSMIKSRSFMEDVIKKLNLTIDYQQLLGKVEVTNPTSSRILQVTVNDPNPQTAADIANEMASVAESKLKEITGMQAIKIYEEAAVPDRPSSPNMKKNCALGLLAGFVLAMAVITILYLLDDTIKTEEDIELRGIRENSNYKNPKLNCVRTALEGMIKGYSNLRIELAPSRMVMTNSEGVDLQIDQLSGGYKAVLSVIADIAKRLSMANPDSLNPLEEEAVILIDELDLHLHPKWQKEIVADLKRTFPNSQFIVSTHSPFIVQSLDADELFDIKTMQYAEEGNYRGRIFV